MIDKKPRLIVRCVDVADVIAVGKFCAREHPAAGDSERRAHAGGLGIADDALVIDLAPIKYTRVDPAARTVTGRRRLHLGAMSIMRRTHSEWPARAEFFPRPRRRTDFGRRHRNVYPQVWADYR